MNDFNVIKPGMYKYAQENSNNGEVSMYKKAFEEEVKREATSKHNSNVEEINNKVQNYIDELNDVATKAKELTGDNAEIKALCNNVLIQPFKTNPFQKIENVGGILVLNGMAPTYKSNETGEYEEEEAFIHTGYVWDIGPECKWLKEGDIVMWTKPSEMMVPFYNFGLVSVNENRILAVVNSGLKERFANG